MSNSVYGPHIRNSKVIAPIRKAIQYNVYRMDLNTGETVLISIYAKNSLHDADMMALNLLADRVYDRIERASCINYLAVDENNNHAYSVVPLGYKA